MTTPTVSHKFTSTTCAQQDTSETTFCTETVVAGYTRVYAAALASLSDTIAQHGSAAGITRTRRGQKGFAGFIGGDIIEGAGDGGTPGTNAPGAYRIKTGTPVTNTGGKVAFEHEDGTRWLEAIQVPGPTTEIYGGPSSGVTRGLRFVGLSCELAATGLVHCNASTDFYTSTGTGGFRYDREVGTVVRTTLLDADGVCYTDHIAGVTGFELRYNGSAKFKYDVAGTATTVDGSYVNFGTIANTAVATITGATFIVISSGTIYTDAATQIDRDAVTNVHRTVVKTRSAALASTQSSTVGTYTIPTGKGVRARVTFSFFNETDSEIANFVMVAAFKNLAGIVTQTSTAVPVETDFYDAAQTGVTGDIDFSGTTVRARPYNPSADTLRCHTYMEVFEI